MNALSLLPGALVRVTSSTVKLQRRLDGDFVGAGATDVQVHRNDIAIILGVAERARINGNRLVLMYTNGHVVSCTGEVSEL